MWTGVALGLTHPTTETPRGNRGVVVMDIVLEQVGVILGAVISLGACSVKMDFAKFIQEFE